MWTMVRLFLFLVIIPIPLPMSSSSSEEDIALTSTNERDESAPSSQQAQSRPNFIIMFADDFGWGDMGANWRCGGLPSDTPFMDGLAALGTRFTDFHAGASVCTPSRASLLTGRLGLRTGTVDNFGPSSVAGLPLNETTFAETFKAAGYRTGMVGKWHLGINGPYHPTSRGFDTYLGVPYSDDMGCVDDPGYNLPKAQPCPKDPAGFPAKYSNKLQDYDDDNGVLALPLIANTTIIEQPLNLSTLAGHYKQNASTFIKQSVAQGKPFLLYAAFTHVHVPLLFNHTFANSSQRGPFGDAVREMDDIVGGIVSAVRAAGVENNTLVWFTSDNGPWEAKCSYAGSSGPFLGTWQKDNGGGSTRKMTIWEGGHREPTFAYWPQHVPAGRVSNSLLSALDIYPTIASIAGIQMPKYRSYDGLDVTDVLLGRSTINNRTLFHPNSMSSGKLGEIGAVRYADYKAVYQTGSTRPACNGLSSQPVYRDPPLIFNLAKDPAEGSPLDETTTEYKNILKIVSQELKALQDDIARDNTTTTNYKTDGNDVPCCNAKHVACRCNN